MLPSVPVKRGANGSTHWHCLRCSRCDIMQIWLATMQQSAHVRLAINGMKLSIYLWKVWLLCWNCSNDPIVFPCEGHSMQNPFQRPMAILTFHRFQHVGLQDASLALLEACMMWWPIKIEPLGAEKAVPLMVIHGSCIYFWRALNCSGRAFCDLQTLEYVSFIEILSQRTRYFSPRPSGASTRWIV